MPEQNGAAAPIRGPHIEPDVTARRRWETANPGAPWTPGANQLRSERDLKTVDGQTYRIYFGTKACRRLEEQFDFGGAGQPASMEELLGLLGPKRMTRLTKIVRILLAGYHLDEVPDDDAAGEVMDRLEAGGDLWIEIQCAFRGMTTEQFRKLLAAIHDAPDVEKLDEETEGPEGSAAATQPTS